MDVSIISTRECNQDDLSPLDVAGNHAMPVVLHRYHGDHAVMSTAYVHLHRLWLCSIMLPGYCKEEVIPGI